MLPLLLLAAWCCNHAARVDSEQRCGHRQLTARSRWLSSGSRWPLQA